MKTGDKLAGIQAIELLEGWLNLLDRAFPLEMVSYNSEDARKALMVIKHVFPSLSPGELEQILESEQ